MIHTLPHLDCFRLSSGEIQIRRSDLAPFVFDVKKTTGPPPQPVRSPPACAEAGARPGCWETRRVSVVGRFGEEPFGRFGRFGCFGDFRVPSQKVRESLVRTVLGLAFRVLVRSSFTATYRHDTSVHRPPLFGPVRSHEGNTHFDLTSQPVFLKRSSESGVDSSRSDGSTPTGSSRILASQFGEKTDPKRILTFSSTASKVSSEELMALTCRHPSFSARPRWTRNRSVFQKRQGRA